MMSWPMSGDEPHTIRTTRLATTSDLPLSRRGRHARVSEVLTDVVSASRAMVVVVDGLTAWLAFALEGCPSVLPRTSCPRGACWSVEPAVLESADSVVAAAIANLGVSRPPAARWPGAPST